MELAVLEGAGVGFTIGEGESALAFEASLGEVTLVRGSIEVANDSLSNALVFLELAFVGIRL
jgi:hypothetical protein